MLTTGTFPNHLKVARVCPVYKGGNRNEISNYRPISILSVFSKVFEGVINIRLENFFHIQHYKQLAIWIYETKVHGASIVGH